MARKTAAASEEAAVKSAAIAANETTDETTTVSVQSTYEAVATKTAASVSVYTVDELAGAAKGQFGASVSLVRAALKCAGVESASLEDAKRIVDEFRKREVK